jgi:hypothetical protein
VRYYTKYSVVLNYKMTRMFHFSPSHFLNQAAVRTFVSLAPPREKRRVGAGPPRLGEIGRAVIAIVKRRRSGCDGAFDLRV